MSDIVSETMGLIQEYGYARETAALNAEYGRDSYSWDHRAHNLFEQLRQRIERHAETCGCEDHSEDPQEGIS